MTLPLGLLALLAASPLGTLLAAGATASTFAEELTLRPLADGKVDAFFSFAISSTSDIGASSHDTLAPSSLLAILDSHQADSFELALTAGTWQHARWGYPLGQTGGSGAEMWASMGDAPNPDDRHTAMTHALSGLFCASLGQSLTNTFTTRPYIPHLVAAADPIPYHTTSPPSGLCTENLTPFLKLLPSKGKSGLSGLLQSHRVLAGQWSSMHVKVWRETAPAGTGAARGRDRTVRIQLGFEIVWDLIGRSKGDRLRDLSIESIFRTALPAAFPPSQASTLRLVLPDGPQDQWTLAATSAQQTADGVATWDLKGDAAFGFELKFTEPTFAYPRSYAPLPLLVRRTVLGADQTEGAFELVLVNNEPRPTEVVLMEEWPWWIGGWLGERVVEVDGAVRDDVVRSLSYTPSVPHERPTTLLSRLALPANSSTRVRQPFLKQFLEYSEHPPDAARGFELCAAVVFPLMASGGGSSSSSSDGRPPLPVRIYTANALVDLPTPDFSMPYNVIIMTSTLLALFFGSVFNLLTRRLVAIRVDGRAEEQKGVAHGALAATTAAEVAQAL